MFKTNYLIIVMLTVLTQGCVTTSETEEASLETLKNPELSDAVVQKIGASNPVLSPFGRNHWISARQLEEVKLKKVQGLLATGEGFAAEKAARKFLESNPGNLEGLTALSSALAMTKQYHLASYYGKLVANKLPNSAHSLNVKALAIMINAKSIIEYKEAESLFRNAFNSTEAEVAAGLNLGSLYLELGDAESAHEVYQQTLSRCNDCYPALMGFGISARRTGRSNEAIDSLKKIIKENEDDPHALYQLALVYKNGTGEIDKANDSLNQLLANEKAPSTLKGHAHTLMRAIKSQSYKNNKPTAASKDANFDDISVNEIPKENSGDETKVEDEELFSE